jgi:hypothetical protein
MQLKAPTMRPLRQQPEGRVYTWSSNSSDANNVMHVALHGWTDPLDEFV